MKFVPVKTTEQQDIQSLHKIRDRFVGHRTRISNQTRGLLSECGLVARPGFKALKALIQEALESGTLSGLFKEELASIYEEFMDLSERLERINNKLKVIAEQHPLCRLDGPDTSTIFQRHKVVHREDYQTGQSLSA